MRIVRIIPQLDFGGVEQVLANSIPSLTQIEGIEVLVVVLGSGGRVEENLVRRGVQVRVLKQNPKIPNLKLLVMLSRLMAEIKPDVVHCQSAEANFHGLIAARLAGAPVRIGEEIGFPNHHSYWKYIFRLVYKNATKVIAISQAVKERIVELGEVESEKVQVVYNPVELLNREKILWSSSLDSSLSASVRNDKGKPFSLGEAVSDGVVSDGGKPFVFVTTCRLVPVKNLERLITAFSRLSHESLGKTMELWIVGDGPLKESLEDQSHDLGISDKVRFWGFQDNVFPFLEMADFFVLPSLSEGSSVSLVEAMAIGLPSIVTKVGGTIEILGQSNSGILIDPVDEESIFGALVQSFRLSTEQRGKLRMKAQNEAKRFAVEKYLEDLLCLYST